MKAIKFIAILAMVLMSFSVQALCLVQKTSIFFINGADNIKKQALDSKRELEKSLARKLVSKFECVTVELAYNQTQRGIRDLAEVFRQESLEEILTPTNFWEMFERLVPARPLFNNLMAAAFLAADPITPLDTEILRQINEHLDTLYRVSPHKDNQLIFVGHSAGNYFANEERLAMTPAERNRTKIVSVATLANNVAGASGPYTTVEQDFYVSTYAGALIPNLANAGTCTDDWACHGWLTSYMVPGSNSRAKIIEDIVALLPKSVQYLRTTTGNPGIPGDGIIVNAGGTFGNSVFELQPYFSLQGITNGITVSVFPQTSIPPQNLSVSVYFRVRGGECVGGTGGVRARTPLVNGVAGIATIFSQDTLNSLIDFLRTSPTCANATVDDLIFAGVNIGDVTNPTEPYIHQLDAVTIGIGENAFPTDATPAP